MNRAEAIRADEETDNIRWVRLRLDTYDTFARAIGREDSRGDKE